jgi:hypothetical protein
MEAQMKKRPDLTKLIRSTCLLIGVAVLAVVFPEHGVADNQLDAVLERTGKQVSAFLDLISETNCTERVLQEKIADSGKVIEKEESTFDYLIILSTSDGELSLVESRIAPEDAKQHKKTRPPLLISNGFSTLFLVFHPYYLASFRFGSEGEETLNGRPAIKIHFQHVPGMRSPAALAVRGREYPLELSGTAWIDPTTGTIVKLTANVDSGMQDVGLRTLHSEVRFSPVTFHDSPEAFWLPAQATVEVETRHQHWRNTHQFSQYRRFAVDTKEQIAKQ